MDINAVLHIVLRLIHIVAAFVWFGIGASMAFFVVPAALAAGENGLSFFKNLFVRTAFSRTFPIAAGVTMLAGLLLYPVGKPWLLFSQTGNIVLGIGAVFGILAGIHGGAVTGRATGELGAALAQQEMNGRPIPADQMAILRGKVESLLSHTRVSFVLMAIALIGMASARLLP